MYLKLFRYPMYTSISSTEYDGEPTNYWKFEGWSKVMVELNFSTMLIFDHIIIIHQFD